MTPVLDYDAVGNPVSLIDPRGNTTQTQFDAARRVIAVTLPAAPEPLVTTTRYDPDGRVIETRQSAAGQTLRTTSAEYTLSGKLARATDANGHVTISCNHLRL